MGLIAKSKKYFLKKRVKTGNVRMALGSGQSKYGRWVGTDIDVLNILKDEDWKYLFGSNRVNSLLAEHVWEHFDSNEALIAAKNCFKYLKDGGIFRVAVPDGNHPLREYRDAVKPGGTGSGSEDHKVLYNYKSLSVVFEQVGFNVEMLEYFDEKGCFHKKSWDVEDGFILRSKDFDPRNIDGEINYSSIILDAVKPRADI